eukprot:1150046-Pelagomonas_calceolata.AAC.3
MPGLVYSELQSRCCWLSHLAKRLELELGALEAIFGQRPLSTHKWAEPANFQSGCEPTLMLMLSMISHISDFCPRCPCPCTSKLQARASG